MHPAAATRPGPPSPPAWDWSAVRRTCLREARRFLAPADAEDAVQNALTRAWKARDSCDNPDAPVGWMLRITRNEALRQLEGRKRLTEREPPTDTTQVDEPAPESEYERLLDELSVSAHLSRLRPEERALVRLCYVHEVPHGDLARLLGISEATVRVRLHRIRERARNVLSGEQ
jgi:RNA polymerase sigma-70 factor, ECF subfamily